MKSNKSTKGFTLIELLIVIAIIGILAAVLIPNLLAARNRANDTATQAYVRNCITAVETERDPVTGALPANGSCEDAAVLFDSALNPISAVPVAGTYAADGTGGFTVTAISVTGATWNWDGNGFNYTDAP